MARRRGRVRLSRQLVLPCAALAAALAFVAAHADGPPQPDFFWPYGTVQRDGANIEPAEQPMIAFVNGSSCGDAFTRIAPEGPDTPQGDAGKTVYVVDVLADGTNPGDRAGCGHPGNPVLFYLPLIGRMAAQQPLFTAGSARVDLDLTIELSNRLVAPVTAADGAP